MSLKPLKTKVILENVNLHDVLDTGDFIYKDISQLQEKIKRVVEVGKNVQDYKPGDVVVIDNLYKHMQIPCGYQNGSEIFVVEDRFVLGKLSEKVIV